MSSLKDHTGYLIYLCKCAVNEERAAEPLPDNIDIKQFFDFCYAHMLTGLAYDTMPKMGIDAAGSYTMLIFKDKHNYAVLKDVTQQHYLDLIREAFNENGIDYMPLKGSVIKDIYPVSYYRQSTDIDILIRAEDRYKAKEIMEGIGFENEMMGDDNNTDNYKADKSAYVELHKTLIPPVSGKYANCNDIVERLIKKEGHEYEMTIEDFYLFMVVHMAKHLKRSAVGIRSILDIFVYRRKYPDMDMTAVDNGLKRCGLLKFHSELIKLVDYWFCDKKADETTLMMADYIAGSGWNGVEEQITAYDLQREYGVEHSLAYIKLKYFLSVAFMGSDSMKVRYPVLENHPYLLPLCWIHRGFSVLFTRKNMLGSVVHEYDGVDKDQAVRIEKMRSRIGIE